MSISLFGMFAHMRTAPVEQSLVTGWDGEHVSPSLQRLKLIQANQTETMSIEMLNITMI